MRRLLAHVITLALFCAPCAANELTQTLVDALYSGATGLTAPAVQSAAHLNCLEHDRVPAPMPTDQGDQICGADCLTWLGSEVAGFEPPVIKMIAGGLDTLGYCRSPIAALKGDGKARARAAAGGACLHPPYSILASTKRLRL